MAARLFNLAAACSAVALCLIAVAWLAAAGVDPRRQAVAVPGGFLSLHARGIDRRVELFSDAANGPYHGSIIGITSRAGRTNGPATTAFGDTAGVYYRRFRWPDGRELWTLSVSLLYPLALAGIVPLIWLARRVRRRREGCGFAVDAA